MGGTGGVGIVVGGSPRVVGVIKGTSASCLGGGSVVVKGSSFLRIRLPFAADDDSFVSGNGEAVVNRLSGAFVGGAGFASFRGAADGSRPLARKASGGGKRRGGCGARGRAPVDEMAGSIERPKLVNGGVSPWVNALRNSAKGGLSCSRGGLTSARIAKAPCVRRGIGAARNANIEGSAIAYADGEGVILASAEHRTECWVEARTLTSPSCNGVGILPSVGETFRASPAAVGSGEPAVLLVWRAKRA